MHVYFKHLHFVWYQQLGLLLLFFFTPSDIWGHSWDVQKSSVSLSFSLNLAKLPGLSCNPCVNPSSRCTLGDSPSPHVILNAPVSRLEHLVVLLLTEEDVRLEQVLVERVHASSQAALLANPLACLDVHYVPCRISHRETLLTSCLTSDHPACCLSCTATPAWEAARTQQARFVVPQAPQGSNSSSGHPLEGGVANQAAQNPKLHQQGACTCRASFADAISRNPRFQVHLQFR